MTDIISFTRECESRKTGDKYGTADGETDMWSDTVERKLKI